MDYGVLEFNNKQIDDMETIDSESDDSANPEIVCTRCYAHFKDLKTLRKHIKEKHAKQVSVKFKCERCRFTCGNKRDLQQHSEECSFDPYKCQFCKKNLTTLRQE